MKSFHRFALLLIYLAAVGCGDPASRGMQRPDKHYSVDLQRHSVHFETATITILSPGPLEKWPYRMSMDQSSYMLDSDTRSYSQLPEVEVVVSWYRLREGFTADLYGGIEALMVVEQQKEGVIELEYQTRDTTVSGLSAIRASTTYRQFGDRAIESVVFGKNNEAWLVHVYVPLEGKNIARRIVESVNARTQVAEQPDTPSREVERLKIMVTLEGKIYINGKEASFKEVKQELERLREVNGIVLYYREGGDSPPHAAESVSGTILYEIGELELPFMWFEPEPANQEIE